MDKFDLLVIDMLSKLIKEEATENYKEGNDYYNTEGADISMNDRRAFLQEVEKTVEELLSDIIYYASLSEVDLKRLSE